MCSDLNRTLLICDRSSFLDDQNRVKGHLERQNFSYKVSVLLPECSSAPSNLDLVLNTFSSFYLIKKLPIFELLDKDFLQSAVNQGSVYGLSFRTRIDEDNCIALMPNGRLILSLDKDSYELLGFEGKPSRFNHRTCSRFVVSVNLRDRNMAPGGRGYMRLLTGLKSRLQLQTDFLLNHHPGGGASLQPLLSRFNCSEQFPKVSRHHLTDMTCPALQSCDCLHLLEWLGTVEAGISVENSSSSFLSGLTCPEPNTMLSNALSISVCGLLLQHDLERLVQELRCYLEQPQLASWVSLTVHPFTDSPVSLGDQEDGVLRGGDHFYNLLMFHDQTYHLHVATGTHHTCPT